MMQTTIPNIWLIHNERVPSEKFSSVNYNKTGRGSKGGLRAANLGRHNKEYYTLWALTNYSIILSQLYYPIILEVWISIIQADRDI